MDGLFGFILAGFALTGSPGPNTLSLAAAGAAFGGKRSIGYMTGLNAGMVVVMAVTATGTAGLLLALPGAGPLVTVAAIAYFLFLALRIATAPPLARGAAAGRQPAFLGGVVQSLVNPKAYAAMAALFSGFVLVAGHVELDAALKIAILTAIIITVNCSWLVVGTTLTRFASDPGTGRLVNVSFAILLVVSVALTLLF